ncbi:uncharacterized protein EI97DRAFT_434488 [Westerdykella ornata]|uniref:Protein kinase domain-containing protein n=1 Tax=Westerdykella ornata TaxID=318751 RepID=A0A6A6JFE3_WESOR|nr:uncharacterized protein EI97DRAFT_434488 [Westerdykella ornata]KAF2275271.1 hypothetical protein EI97DRAFT_434488 [Westerdykella ornata]
MSVEQNQESAQHDSDPAPYYEVIDCLYSDFDTECRLVVLGNYKQICIYVDEKSVHGSPPMAEKYLHFLRVMNAPDNELDGLDDQDFYNWITDFYHPILRSFPPLPEDFQPTLQDRLCPNSANYTLHVVDGEVVPMLDLHPNRAGGRRLYGVYIDDYLSTAFPSLHPRSVPICKCPRGTLSPHKVIIDGTVYWFKHYLSGDDDIAGKEISNYKTIAQAGLESDLRMSRLHGLVRDDETGRVFGLLLDYIDGKSMAMESLLRNASMDARRKWAVQIGYTVWRLHESGIVWGDAKADNVLIDHDDNAWVIDFGGARTEGWVEEDLTETVQGDLQGLGRIIEFLEIEDMTACGDGGIREGVGSQTPEDIHQEDEGTGK